MFLDEISDVYVGNSSKKSSQIIKGIFGSSSSNNSLTECLVTVLYGLDFVNSQQFVFLTKSIETSRSWCNELRKFFVRNHKQGERVRLFAKSPL